MSGADDEPLLGTGGYEFSVTIDDTEIVTMTLPTVYSGFFGVTYDTPNGNQPIEYGNQVLVFEGGPFVQAGALPVGSAPAALNGGSYVYPAHGTSFSTQPYVCAYSVGPFSVVDGKGSYPNLAATAFLPGGVGGTEPIQFTSSALGIQTAQTAFITWSYTLPAGTDPSANGAWIGLWNGTVVPYEAKPDFFAPIVGSQSSGLAPMPDLSLAGTAQYLAALFTSGYSPTASLLKLTAIAAVVSFTTGPPKPP